jgi:two-component system, NarL family, nitrate/nitrite response regulator NarL
MLSLSTARTGAGRLPVARAALIGRAEEVLDLLSRGLSNRAIAQALVITEKTTEAHVSNILRKLNLTSRAQAAVWAVQHQSTAS